MYHDTLPILFENVAAILRQHPQGISEYALITRLREAEVLPEELRQTGSTLELFHLHFLLFHTLYQLRDHYWQTETGQLEISPLNIRLLPYVAGETVLATADPLRDYYLDLEQLQTTAEEDVVELLSQFWLRLDGGEERSRALQTLGLQDPVDYATIKTRYRELVMQHHPDRGGDTTLLQQLNAAMEWLARYHAN